MLTLTSHVSPCEQRAALRSAPDLGFIFTLAFSVRSSMRLQAIKRLCNMKVSRYFHALPRP